MDEPLWQAGQVSRSAWPLLKPWMVRMGAVVIGLQSICQVSLQLEVHGMRTALPYADVGASEPSLSNVSASLAIEAQIRWLAGLVQQLNTTKADRSGVSRVEDGLQTLRAVLGESRSDVRRLNLSKADESRALALNLTLQGKASQAQLHALQAAMDEDRSEVSRVEKGLQTLRVALGESRSDVRQLNLSKADESLALALNLTLQGKASQAQLHALQAAMDEDRSKVSRVEKGLQMLSIALGESRNEVDESQALALNLTLQGHASQAQLHALQAAMDEDRSARNTTADAIQREIGRMQSKLMLADQATLTPFQSHRPGSVSPEPGLVEYASVRQGASVSATPPCLVPGMTQNAILPFDRKVRASDGDLWFKFQDTDAEEQVLLVDLGDVRPLHRVGAILRTPGPGGQYTDRMTWQRFDVRGSVTKENILHLGTMSETDLLQLNTSSTDWNAMAMFTVGGVRARFVRYSFGRTPSTSGSYGSDVLRLLSDAPYGSRVLQLFAQGPEL